MQQKAVQLGDAGLFYLHRCTAVGQATLQAKILIQNTEYNRSHQCSVKKKLFLFDFEVIFIGWNAAAVITTAL